MDLVICCNKKKNTEYACKYVLLQLYGLLFHNKHDAQMHFEVENQPPVNIIHCTPIRDGNGSKGHVHQCQDLYRRLIGNKKQCNAYTSRHYR